MAKTNVSGLKRILNAFRYSALGYIAAWRHEAAFRQEVYLSIVLTPFAFIIGASFLHTALLMASLVLILIVELLNSAIEAAVDRISDDHHHLSARAKDIGSAAVLTAFGLSFLLWAGALLDTLVN